MSTVLTVVRADCGEAENRGVRAEIVQLVPEVYTVICNGEWAYPSALSETMRHACPQGPDVLIEPFDTWSSEESAIEFANMHIRAHEERG